MNWIEQQQQMQNLEDYQSYKITLALKGNMTPSRASIIRLINSKRKDKEKCLQT